MARRLNELNLRTHLINPAYLELRLDPEARRWFDGEISQALSQASLNQDLRPVGLYEGLSLRYAPFSKKIPGALKALRTQPPARLISSLFLAWLILSLLATRRHPRTAPLSLAAGTTGFFGISIQIATLLLFQSLLGLLYFWLAVLTTSFMIGTCAGAILAHKREERARASIVAAETLLTLAPVSLLAITMALDRHMVFSQGIAQGLLAASSFSAGFLVGFEIPLAFSVLRLDPQDAPAAARLGAKLYGLDLTGACLGAVITPLILIPSCGLPALLLLLYAVKASSGLNIAFSGTRSA
jgi:hypothetical protein